MISVLPPPPTPPGPIGVCMVNGSGMNLLSPTIFPFLQTGHLTPVSCCDINYSFFLCNHIWCIVVFGRNANNCEAKHVLAISFCQLLCPLREESEHTTRDQHANIGRCPFSFCEYGQGISHA